MWLSTICCSCNFPLWLFYSLKISLHKHENNLEMKLCVLKICRVQTNVGFVFFVHIYRENVWRWSKKIDNSQAVQRKQEATHGDFATQYRAIPLKVRSSSSSHTAIGLCEDVCNRDQNPLVREIQGWPQPIICLHLTPSSASSPLTPTDSMPSLTTSLNISCALPSDLLAVSSNLSILLQSYWRFLQSGLPGFYLHLTCAAPLMYSFLDQWLAQRRDGAPISRRMLRVKLLGRKHLSSNQEELK